MENVIIDKKISVASSVSQSQNFTKNIINNEKLLRNSINGSNNF